MGLVPTLWASSKQINYRGQLVHAILMGTRNVIKHEVSLTATHHRCCCGLQEHAKNKRAQKPRMF